ncbi:MAG: hypothetical protein JWQ81_6469 [Amycolatopsis sp.]|jgi:hypothetical protein|uniref:hypothetical protein n=1 Tax=Amycolatopsis sp. TaxID=37632 RepID=UPI0026292428|nr:hypothetical protein [Amycolatopsis sp.]MCU1685730.1 hypothetical protein [Amycolatopsis sp.]
MTEVDPAEQIEQVRQRYAAAARRVTAGQGTGLAAGPDEGRPRRWAWQDASTNYSRRAPRLDLTR